MLRTIAKLWRSFNERYVYDELADVRRLHEKNGILNSREPSHLTQALWTERADFLQEELDELREAIARQDLAQILDALVDMTVVAKGTALMAGLPWEDAWLEVHRANMEKVRGTTKRGHKVDLMKPSGWQQPQIHEVLLAAGYSPDTWEHPDRPGVIFEGACVDDLEDPDYDPLDRRAA